MTQPHSDLSSSPDMAIDRRTLLQIAGAAAGLSLGAAAPVLAGEPRRGIYKAIFDRRYADARAFGLEAGRMGMQTTAIDGDVTALWYDDLYHRWKTGPTLLVGLTDRSALFCLETFANDAGMRVTFRNHYRMRSDGPMHEASGDASMLAAARSAPAGAVWAPVMARLVSACPTVAAPASAEHFTAPCVVPTADAHHLTAWAIAPMQRA
jgi:hypothetical protein